MMKQALCLFFLLVAITGLDAQNGVLDPLFGTGGIVVMDVDNSDNISKSMVVQPDGKIIVAGFSTTTINMFSLVRLNPDGSPDNSFGINGVVNTALPSSGIASGLVLQPDGKIIAGGHSWGGAYNEFTLIRYNSNGSLDATFGNGGMAITSFAGKSGVGKSLALQPDGKIILAGFAYDDFSDFDDFALARYHTDGSIDSTFGINGVVITSFGLTQDWINTVKLQADGKIIAGGFAGHKTAMARYHNDGSLDTAFGTGGLVTNPISTASQAQITGMVLEAGGIYTCGYAIDSFSNSIIVKYDYNGNLSPGFGVGGILINNIAPQYDLYKDIKIRGDKIVAGGTANIGGIPHFTLSQYDLAGNPVASFGTGGVFTVAPVNAYNQLEAIEIQNDGKILATGFCQNHPYDIGIVRVISTTLVSVNEPDAESETRVYPNPTSGMLYIHHPAGSVTDIKLLDVTGKVLAQRSSQPGFHESEWQLDMQHHTKGVYLLVIGTGQSGYVHKIVKQ